MQTNPSLAIKVAVVKRPHNVVDFVLFIIITLIICMVSLSIQKATATVSIFEILNENRSLQKCNSL